jgi:hypothetical protein
MLNGIGALDHRVIHFHRIRAATAGAAVIRAAQLGFNIAAQRQVDAEALLDLLEQLGVTVEPVGIAVKYHARRGLGGHAPLDGRQSLAIAVQAADYIEHVAVEQRLTAKGVLRQAIVQWAVAAGAHQAVLRSQPGSR